MLAGGGEGLTRGRPHGAGPARLLQPSRGGTELADSGRVRPPSSLQRGTRAHTPPTLAATSRSSANKGGGGRAAPGPTPSPSEPHRAPPLPGAANRRSQRAAKAGLEPLKGPLGSRPPGCWEGLVGLEGLGVKAGVE